MEAPVHIILLNFNGADDTIECLNSLGEAVLDDARIILIDNGSTDDSVNRLAGWNERTAFFSTAEKARLEDLQSWKDSGFPKNIIGAAGHTLIYSAANLGFAAGNNAGTRLALDRGATEVLLLNNDTTVRPDFLIRLRQTAIAQPGAVLIPQIRLYHQPENIWNCGGELLWPGRKQYHFEGAKYQSLPQVDLLPVSFVTGCALWYRPLETGLLTEAFFFGEEDMEFSMRLREKEIPAYCDLTAIIYHKVGSTLSANYRKSEIFTLKRLINLRMNLRGLSRTGAFIYYLVNLYRLLVSQYKLSPGEALQSVNWVKRNAMERNELGKDICVDYVLGNIDRP